MRPPRRYKSCSLLGVLGVLIAASACRAAPRSSIGGSGEGHSGAQGIAPEAPQNAAPGSQAAPATISGIAVPVEPPAATPVTAPAPEAAAADPAAGDADGGPPMAGQEADPNLADPNLANPNHLVNFGKPDPLPVYDGNLTNPFVPAEIYAESDNGYPECEHPPQVDFGYNGQVPGCPTRPLGVQLPMQGYCHLNYNFKIDPYASNPPASGDHWPSPSHALGINRYPVARESWVHSMEHGAVILAYNCPDGCPYELDILEQAVRARAASQYKVLLTPDPRMPANRFAAISWTWLYLFSVPDLQSLICFIDQHVNHGRENDKAL